MIEPEKRKAIYLLHDEGMAIREISTKLHVSRKSVRKIIATKGSAPRIKSINRKQVSEELMIKLYADCEGFVQRIHEKLKEENGVDIGYSTLTRMIRSLGLGVPDKDDMRDCKVPDVPGQEMQHDTSPYDLMLGNCKTKVVCSSLYLRYSKRRYLKFYPHFTRFQMQCFFHEALMHFGYVAETCIIDNTNLAVYSGSGPNAVMSSEMIKFAQDHGDFKWKAHRIMHSDRKGGIESGFWFLETNFFPGRKFESFEDLNQQALEWSTKRIAQKPHSKTKLIPAELFEFEKSHLKKLPPFVPAPVRSHFRDIDQYGYAPFEGNFYWVPGSGRGEIQLLEYSDKVRIIKNRELLIEHPLAAYGVKQDRIRPEGLPKFQLPPTSAQRSTQPEEERLRAIDPIVSVYIELLQKVPASKLKKYQTIRKLHSLSLKLSRKLFLETLNRALKYSITSMETVERIAILLMRDDHSQIDPDFTDVEISEDIQSRANYREGELSGTPDFTKYDDLLNGDDMDEIISTTTKKGDTNG